MGEVKKLGCPFLHKHEGGNAQNVDQINNSNTKEREVQAGAVLAGIGPNKTEEEPDGGNARAAVHHFDAVVACDGDHSVLHPNFEAKKSGDQGGSVDDPECYPMIQAPVG